MLNVAIIGAGIGREHLEAYLALPDRFRVTHIIDRDLARIEEIRMGADFEAAADIETALSSDTVDIIDICLPPRLHAPVTIDALAAGKHVICEKPLAGSLSEVDTILAAAAQCRTHVFPMFQYRYGPALNRLQALIDAGLAGAPFAAAIETHWSRGAEYYAAPWRGTWEAEQGGAVLGHAIHNHYLLSRFFGPIVDVTALLATRVNPIETEDCASIAFRMESGALATSSVTLGAATNESRLRFTFEHLTATSGSVPYNPGSVPWTFLARDPNNQSRIDALLAEIPDSHIGFTGYFEAVSECLENGQAAPATLDDGRRSIELVTAIYQAARTRQTVSLPLTKNSPLYQSWMPHPDSVPGPGPGLTTH